MKLSQSSLSLSLSVCLLLVVRSRAGMSPWVAGDNEVDINEALLQFSGRANTVTRERYNGCASVTQAYRSFSLRMARLTRYVSEGCQNGRQFDQVSFAESQPRWTSHAKQSMGRGKIRVYVPQYPPRPVPPPPTSPPLDRTFKYLLCSRSRVKINSTERVTRIYGTLCYQLSVNSNDHVAN